MKKYYLVTMSDSSVWIVPVEIIARNRAEVYKDEFGGDVERSLKEDTMPLFEADIFEIEDWACNNMNWSDVKDHAVMRTDAEPPSYADDWVNPKDTDYE
jgi:hypothetical protein